MKLTVLCEVLKCKTRKCSLQHILFDLIHLIQMRLLLAVLQKPLHPRRSSQQSQYERYSKHKTVFTISFSVKNFLCLKCVHCYLELSLT